MSNKSIVASFAGLLIAASLFGGAVPVATAQTIEQCLTPADANAAVQSGMILKLPRVLQAAGIDRNATLHNQQVCYVFGELAYVLDVLDASGMTRQLILRGSDGSPYS